MYNKKVILGHCNPVLAGIIDILYQSHTNNIDQIQIDIVSNIKDEINGTDDVPYPYAIDELLPNINEYFHDEYMFNINTHNTIFSFPFCNYILGVNSPISKRKVYDFFETYYNINSNQYCNVIAKNVNLPIKIELGNGCMINYGTTIGPYTKLSNFVTINRNTSIGHHNTIDEYVTISPGVNIAGHCKIGKNTLIGIGSTIINNITIGKNVIIGAGSVVTRDIPDNVVYYGVPAKFIRENNI